MTTMLSCSRTGDTVLSGRYARPPLLYLGCLALGLVLDRLLPLPLTFPSIPWTAGAVVLAGMAVMAAGIRNFSRAATPVPCNQPVRALVTTGIHAWSRNPIYLGMFVVYAGIASVARSPWALILGIPLAIVVRYGIVAREEKYLERHFGDAYRDYKARVRRWL